jgi:hypothetical protein
MRRALMLVSSPPERMTTRRFALRFAKARRPARAQSWVSWFAKALPPSYQVVIRLGLLAL